MIYFFSGSKNLFDTSIKLELLLLIRKGFDLTLIVEDVGIVPPENINIINRFEFKNFYQRFICFPHVLLCSFYNSHPLAIIFHSRDDVQGGVTANFAKKNFGARLIKLCPSVVTSPTIDAVFLKRQKNTFRRAIFEFVKWRLIYSIFARKWTSPRRKMFISGKDSCYNNTGGSPFDISCCYSENTRNKLKQLGENAIVIDYPKSAVSCRGVKTKRVLLLPSQEYRILGRNEKDISLGELCARQKMLYARACEIFVRNGFAVHIKPKDEFEADNLTSLNVDKVISYKSDLYEIIHEYDIVFGTVSSGLLFSVFRTQGQIIPISFIPEEEGIFDLYRGESLVRTVSNYDDLESLVETIKAQVAKEVILIPVQGRGLVDLLYENV